MKRWKTENGVTHIFYVAIYVFYFRKHLQQNEVQNFHCLSQLLKGFKKKMINRNHKHKRKLAKYPCHLDGTREDLGDEK